MSLINEALKKAQRQRNLEATPVASAPSGIAAAAVTTHVRAASHRSSNAPLWFGLGLLLLGAVVTAVVILFVLNPSPSPASNTAAVQPAVSVAASTPKPVVAAPTLAPEAPLPTITVPSMSAPVVASPPQAHTPVPAPSPAPAVVTTPAPAAPVTPAPAPIPAPAAGTTPPPPVPVAAATPEPTRPAPVTVAAVPPAPRPATPAPVAVTPVTITQEAKVYAVIDKLRITGVRGTGNEARVLMNEKVYRINDLVDRELGLRLVEVTSSQLGFVDATGQRYKKQL